MLLGTRKRGHAAGGGGPGPGPALLGNHGFGSYARPDPPGLSGGGGGGGGGGGACHGDNVLDVALLDALGLGSFARLDLPAPPDGLDLTAAVKPSSNCIIVSMGGDSITASPRDLAAALSLRLGTFALPEEVNAAMFSSVEAIAAVRDFVHDRLLLGGIGNGQSSAAFLEYRKMMCEESGVSSLDVVADEKNRVRLIQQQQRAHEIINGIQRPVLLKFSACAMKIRVLLAKLTDLNKQVQRLKVSRSIPDLNVPPHL
uniref:Uncharacterized protein n=1 Tax=Avena sativa TaxID=4498 RepID=A0ACD5W1G2_AVESA